VCKQVKKNRNKVAVVALGGNAISIEGGEDSIPAQFANTRRSLDGVVELARDSYDLVILHGNGPQVGNMLLRTELTRDKAPVLPLGVLVADTGGGIGYMIQQSLQNRFHIEGIDRKVVTLITQVVVDANDPAIKNPTKFIGQSYTREEMQLHVQSRGWVMKEDGSRGWRRVVPSPTPLEVVEGDCIRKLISDGTIVIAAGGGGIPVYYDRNGNLEGLDAVIDKDLAAALVGRIVGAGLLSILTSVDSVALNYNQPEEKKLGLCTLDEIKEYYQKGHFPPGGELVTITSFENARDSVHGEVGTRITPQ
jgi:carbamate kinase